MAQSTRSRSPLGLAAVTYASILVSVVVMALAATGVFWARSQNTIDETLDFAVRSRAQAAASSIGHLLYSDWIDLHHLVKEAGSSDLNEIEKLMDGMRGDGSRISWIGYAGLDGTVLAAAEGLLEGADVSQRPWFRNGLRSGFAGDVHEAVLLAQKLSSEGGTPLRFIDLALPVHDSVGDVTGVVGMHIDASWMEQILTEIAQMQGLDLYLINQAGRVIMTSGVGLPGPGEARLIGAARAGAETAGRETWPDGKAYFTTLVSSVSYRDLPSFGWRLAARISADSFRPGLTSLLVTSIVAFGVALVVLLIFTFFFVRLFVRPISALAANAEALARGEERYPPESQSTAEAARFSRALAALQSYRGRPRSKTG